jgi:anaerobic magnesium-protoporphyrin IX monomethyl ester cyclase
MKKFKVMFIFVNDRMRTFIPLNIAYLSAALKEANFDTCLFDTSFYPEQGRLSEEAKKEEAGIFQSVDYQSIGVKLKTGRMLDDLLESIAREKPNLVAFSVFSQSRDLDYRLAEEIKRHFPEIKTVFGGIHVNIEPREVVSHPAVDFICLGEGDEALPELCEALATGDMADSVRNVGRMKDGEYCQNPMRPAQHLDDVCEFPDWDLFEPYHLYGPYRGQLLKMALVEFSRQCPFKCTYCGNLALKDNYEKSGVRFNYRHKSPKKFIAELKHMKDHYEIEFLNIVDGTFTAQKRSVLEEVAELYIKEINLPFFCDATVTCFDSSGVKARLLAEMGCVCVNIGLEVADEEYRLKYMDRPGAMSNDQIVNAFLQCKNAGLDTRSYNIVGLPYQTRESIMETVELNRAAKVGSLSLSIFMPYEGTALRDLCIKDGLFDPNLPGAGDGDGTEPVISNPYLSDTELMGLYNTYALYVFLPKKLWPDIQKAEEMTPDGAILRKELVRLMNEITNDSAFVDFGVEDFEETIGASRPVSVLPKKAKATDRESVASS